MSRGDLTLTLLLFNEQVVLSLKECHKEPNVQDNESRSQAPGLRLTLPCHSYPQELCLVAIQSC